MRTEFVYSVIALGAIPVMANAADVNVKATQINAEVLQSANGKLDLGKIALAPGKYALKGLLTSKVYDVKIKVDGEEKFSITAGPSAVELGDKDVVIDLTKKTGITEVAISLESTDPTESGADFTFGAPFINLSFDFYGAVEALKGQYSALAAKINGYAYSDAFESLGTKYVAKQEDVDSLGRINLKIGNIKTDATASYEDYLNFKLYAEKSTIQEEIEALDTKTAAAEAAFQNEKAYNEVNAAITAIKGQYNTAVAELELTLVDAAAYLLNAAKKDLNDNINVKITEATQASYASYKAKTAVKDKDANMAIIPTNKALSDIVDDWKTQAQTNKNAYNALNNTVTDLKTDLNNVKPVEAIASLFPKTEALAAIDAVNTKVETARNSANQLTLGDDADFKKDVKAAQDKISDLADKVNTANAEYAANEATKTVIDGLKTNLNNAKNTVNKLKYGDTSVESYYTDYVAGVQTEIDKYTTDAATAYKADGTGNAQKYYKNLDVTATQKKIDDYKVGAKAAVDNYKSLQSAINTPKTGYQAKLDAARAEFEGLDIYEAEGYDYKTKLDLIQKRIKDIEKKIAAAQKLNGSEHWTAMSGIQDDLAIPTDIENLLAEKTGKQNKYVAESLDKNIAALNDNVKGRFEKFATDYVPTGNTKLGADYGVYAGVENEIVGDLETLIIAKDAVNPDSETADKTKMVGQTINDWQEGEVAHNGAEGRTTVVDETTFVEQYGYSEKTGSVLVQTIKNLPNGKYTVKLLAFAGLGGTVDSKDYVHVFANGKTEPVKVTEQSAKNVYTITDVEVTDGTLSMGLTKDKGGTLWHGIQILSLEANTASLIQKWGEEVAAIADRQTAIENVAAAVAAKVTANTTDKTDLGTNIGNLQTAMGTFETTYKVGQDDSPLGLRGKAKGEVTVEVGDINAKLTTLAGNNTAVDVTAVADSLMTFKVGTAAANWGGIGLAETKNAPAVNEKQMAEAYDGSSCTQTGTILSQTITGLENGIYNVVLCANAQATGVDKEHAITADATDVAYVFVNGEKQWITAKVGGNVTANGEFEFANVIVSDGTLTLGLEKVKAGTNWHTIQIKSLTYRENASKLLPTYNKEYLDLSKRKNALDKKARTIVAEVEANAATLTAAKNAITALQTTELNTLKSLANVTDANAESTDAVAKKADPEDWKVFETGLKKGKSYTEKKTAIDDDINTMLQAVKDTAAAETLTAAWKNNSISVTKKVGEDDVTTTYSIATITTAINNLKTEAENESKNYLAYKGLQDNNMSKLLPDTIFTKMDGENRVVMSDAEIEAIVGAGAKPYYVGLKTKYITGKAGILTRMQADLNARKAVSTKDDFVAEITDSIAKVKVVKSDAIANKKRYDAQVKAYNETQTLWNATYTEIAATDKSSMVQKWLDELDGIQVTLTAATQAVEKNYPLGKSVAETQDFAAIKAKIEDVKARQSESYNESVAADNAAHHATFIKQINAATEAYQKAVKDRAMYSSTNTDIEAAVTTAAATLDAALYSCPTDIETLTANENAAYEKAVSPKLFDVSEFIAKYDLTDPDNPVLVGGALYIEQKITEELGKFTKAVKEAIENDVWSPKKDGAEGYDAKVVAAKAAIKDFDYEGKANAFKDVEDLIADGDDGVKNMILAEVEAAIEHLKNIDAMLADDKNAAAEKDITPRLAAAEEKYTDVKADIEKVTNNIPEKAEQLANLKKAYDDGKTSNNDLAYAKTLDKTFANHNAIVKIINDFVKAAGDCADIVKNAVDDDNANTKAYNEMTVAIAPVAKKLADAKAAAAPYKYATSFAGNETTLANIKAAVEEAKKNGKAVTYQTNTFDVATLSAAIEKTLSDAFDYEKAGLATDITELKNQYNAYVAENGLNDKAAAFKKDIDDLAAALAACKIADDDDDPADGQYDEMKEATEALIELQGDIADKETELLAANASTANATVLANFNTKLAKLEAAATLDGNDAWVGDQKVGDKKISDAIAEIQAQIADAKAAIAAEKNISFYKDQYQEQIDAIENALTPVTEAIAEKQALYTANAEAYTTLSAKIDELQGKVNDAKAKVSAYEYASTKYIADLEKYTKKVLTGGIQKDINEKKTWLKEQNDAVALNAKSNLGTLEASVNSTVQDYLDKSANSELNSQIDALNNNLIAAIAIGKHVGVQKYSSALWDRLIDVKKGIDGEIADLNYEVWNSNQVFESTAIDVWVYVNNKQVAKECTSDKDYADQMVTVEAIAQEIADLATAVDNLDLLGDANVDGRVNVLDYQKVLNMILDPTLQPADNTDLFKNIDINKSDVIEVGDLTALVNYILKHDWQGYAAARGEKMEGESLSMTQETNRIAVNLANVNDYTAFQLDLVLPEGMKFVGAELGSRAGESHKLYSRAQLDGSIRMVASSVKGETFSGNEGAVLYINVEGAGTPELLNILFSDVDAVTRSFAIGNDATGIDTVSTFESLKQKVYDLGGRVKESLKKGINIIRRADGTTGKVVK